MRLRTRTAGHVWTIAPSVRGRARPAPTDDTPWSTIIDGDVRIAGAFAPGSPDARDLYLVVHGLGGSADSTYILDAVAAIQARGHASLRISMRGAGDSSPDFFHAGLGTDLLEILADPSLARFERVYVIGFSMGGHLALRAACLPERDPRIAAVAAVCAPLDLLASIDAIDHPRAWVYRRYVLAGLESIYARRFAEPRRFETIRAWDREVVVPRWGFTSVEHYWRSQSAGPRLVDLGVPTLFVAAIADPMIPASTLRPHVERARRVRPSTLDVAWVERGGHVGFPSDLDLGMAGERGLMPQLLTWFSRG